MAAAFVRAQLPASDIWLFGISTGKNGEKSLTEPVKISGTAHYNNQPAFSRDSRSIYYSAGEGTQTDIYQFSVKSKKNIRITQTSESEFSPRPSGDGKMISVVTVEKDSSQRIHFIGTENGQHVKTLNSDSIGYYCFLNSDTVVFYKLTDPHALYWRSVSDGEEHFIARGPARGFTSTGRQQVLFGIPDSSVMNYFVYDLATRKIHPYASDKPGANDVFWHPRLGLVVARGKTLFKFDPEKYSWIRLFDISHENIKKITRFVFDPGLKYLVVVNDPN